jgi:hypothetical protein
VERIDVVEESVVRLGDHAGTATQTGALRPAITSGRPALCRRSEVPYWAGVSAGPGEHSALADRTQASRDFA